MNRIRELRDIAGLTADELAIRMGTTAKQIYRLEKGERRLTTEWMEKIAKALHCAPGDLISGTAAVAEEDDVDLFEPEGVTGQVLSTMRALGFTAYTVLGDSVSEAGVRSGDTITVRHLAGQSVEGLKPLDVVLVSMGGATVLRQFVPPLLLVTNRTGANLAVRLDDPSAKPRLVGVVVRDALAS